jgi:hypothetical protein
MPGCINRLLLLLLLLLLPGCTLLRHCTRMPVTVLGQVLLLLGWSALLLLLLLLLLGLWIPLLPLPLPLLRHASLAVFDQCRAKIRRSTGLLLLLLRLLL